MYFSLCHENSFFLKEDTTFIRFSINNSQFLNLAKPIADKIDTAIYYIVWPYCTAGAMIPCIHVLYHPILAANF